MKKIKWKISFKRDETLFLGFKKRISDRRIGDKEMNISTRNTRLEFQGCTVSLRRQKLTTAPIREIEVTVAGWKSS